MASTTELESTNNSYSSTRATSSPFLNINQTTRDFEGALQIAKQDSIDTKNSLNRIEVVMQNLLSQQAESSAQQVASSAQQNQTLLNGFKDLGDILR